MYKTAQVAMLLFTTVMPAWGQRLAPPTEQRGQKVTILLTDDLPRRDLIAVVTRNPSGLEREIIALKRSAATPALLSAALAGHAWLRKRGGATPSEKLEVHFRKGGPLPPAIEDPTWLAATVGQLLRAQPRNVEGVGHVPAITLTLPETGAPLRRWRTS
jgi:hypothetical protein